MTKDAKASNNATVPKNILATRNANRSIRKGVIFNWPSFLPTPMTAFNASFIRTIRNSSTLL